MKPSIGRGFTLMNADQDKNLADFAYAFSDLRTSAFIRGKILLVMREGAKTLA